MKQIKRNLHAEWEVISSAEWLEGLGRDPTNEEMLQIFEGSFYPLFNTKRVEPKQTWKLKITTYLECDDGTTSECEMVWKFDKPMSMHEVLNGAKHIRDTDLINQQASTLFRLREFIYGSGDLREYSDEELLEHQRILKAIVTGEQALKGEG